MDGRARLPNADAPRPEQPETDADPAAPPGTAPRSLDESRARAARNQLRRQGIVPVEPDDRIRVMLGEGEQLVAVRRAVEVNRRRPCPDTPGGVGGDLYVTTRRLVHLGRRSMAYELGEIHEAVVAGERLLLVLADGLGLAIAVDDPQHLRVEIAAARAAAKGEARASSAADLGVADDSKPDLPRQRSPR